ncbi:MAG TPA: ABC transporter permease, partial [Methanocorpusculum sp.]|nr:ABC transporter permease [Methanocorpusculum sp.]
SILGNSGVSILRVGLGFVTACVIAVPLGVLIGSHPSLERFSDGLIQILRPIPPLAWIPLSLVWFGISMKSIVFIIVIGCIFPILVSTIDGVKRVKKSWLETAKIYQANSQQIMTRVTLPAALPAIWNGLRIGFGIAWMSVVAAEMVPGSTTGLGYMIYNAFTTYSQLSLSIAGMVCIGIIGIVMDLAFKLVQKKKFAWEVLDK